MERRMLRALRRIVRAVDGYSREVNATARVTVPQLLCLQELRRDTWLTPTGLARRVSLAPSTVSGIVDRLILKGLVKRRRSRSDRRQVELSLTDTGADMVAQAPPTLQERFTTRLARLSGERQAVLTEALEQVVALMDAEHLDAAPHLISGSAIAAETGVERNELRTASV